eukprot:c13783_g1_i1.p1 GENE.c13783_g1_i1~~c13783_g1_i1.p1  ORF type:complete len:105 (-),score=25.43 c13783_g1_i1:24-338(-)
MRDSVATNGAAMKIIEGYRRALDINCFSHVGDHLKMKEADEAVSALIGMHSTSTIAKSIWKEHFGGKRKSVSATRWWSRFEFCNGVETCWSSMGQLVEKLIECE